VRSEDHSERFGFCIANRISFGAKSDHGVNPRSALCGQPAGKRNRGREDCAAAYPCENIRRGHFSPVILNQSEATPRYESADGEPNRKQTRALIRDELNDLSRCCSQGTANSEFALTSCDLQREQSIQADGG
jgi:hypothetical protein